MAARQPLALVVLLVAIATGLTVALWLLPAGIVVYLVMVVLAARDSGLIKAAQRTTSTRITSKTFRQIVGEIDRSQREIEKSVAQAGGPLEKLLQSISLTSEQLVEQAHMLAGKGQIIESYLAQVNYHQLQDQINQLDDQIGRTTDSYTIQQLQDTRQAIIDRQRNAHDLETYIGRILAQLQNIDANLDNVLAETVRLRTSDVVSAASSSNQVRENLDNLRADMSAFSHILDTALHQSGAA